MHELWQMPIIASFVAGVFTFGSPCILPLIPAYISFITGLTLDELQSNTQPLKTVFLNALFFVCGFSLVFVALGASASALGGLIGDHKDVLRWIGGIVVIVFGFHLTGLFKIKFLYYQKNIQLKQSRLKYLAPFLFGLAFAIGWTPCVGPILSSILILASTQETISRGVLLLSVYSLGLGLPFLLTALFINAALRVFNRIKRFYHIVEIASGAILILVGVLIITNGLQHITKYLMIAIGE
ncbi:MAG: cytochrome c biogenesis protein CcdA [Elusimicrobia bacterium]|nr:cytochrome c biogenesis protein CcdA [Elusimicrobiota bacterium]